MKRSSIKRRTPLKSSRRPIARRTPIRKVNRERVEEKHQRNFDGGIDHDTWIRTKDCVLCVASKKRQTTVTQAAHERARGMGGCNGDYTDLTPLCFFHHEEHGQIGTGGIEAFYGVDLHEVAAAMLAEHLNELTKRPKAQRGKTQ